MCSSDLTGALTGAGLAVKAGMGPAYAVVTALYLTSVGLTMLAGYVRKRSTAAPATHREATAPETVKDATKRPSPWADLREGMTYVWRTPHLRSIMLLAFLLNATAFPIFVSLMPYLVRGVYHETQTTLGFMTACASSGALLGSKIGRAHV